MFKQLALVAAMTAAFTSVAQAQSNLTIYGRLNTTVERIDNNGATSTEMRDNSSRIGFKGTEDIGNGLKAGFVIETGFDATTGEATGGARFWGREATVHLSHSGFGTVRLGNLPSSEAYFATADYISMHNHDTGTSADALYALGFNLATGRLQNTVAYTSPVISGFRFDAQVSEDGDAVGPRRVALAGNYDAGPLHVGLGYEEFNGIKSVALRGLYEMGAFTFGAYIEQNSGSTDVDSTDAGRGLLATDADRTNFRLTAMYAMGASEFHVNFGQADEIGNQANTDAQQYTLGYNYNLSKRTKLYGFYTAFKTDSADAGTLYGLGQDFTSLAVGIRHNF